MAAAVGGNGAGGRTIKTLGKKEEKRAIQQSTGAVHKSDQFENKLDNF